MRFTAGVFWQAFKQRIHPGARCAQARLERTNALLADEISVLSQERDSLKSRLGAARARVDALLDRLPEAIPGTDITRNSTSPGMVSATGQGGVVRVIVTTA